MAAETAKTVPPWYPWYMTKRLPYQTLNAQMVKVMPLLLGGTLQLGGGRHAAAVPDHRRRVAADRQQEQGVVQE